MAMGLYVVVSSDATIAALKMKRERQVQRSRVDWVLLSNARAL